MTAVFYPICVHKQFSKLHGCSSLATQMCVTYQPVKDFPWISFNLLLVGSREGESEAGLLMSAESDTTHTGRHFIRRSKCMFETFGYEHKFHWLYFVIFFSRTLLGFAHIFNARKIWWANGIWQHWCKYFKDENVALFLSWVWCVMFCKIDIWEVSSRCLLIWTLHYIMLCAAHWQNCVHKQRDSKWRTGLMCAS